MQNTYMIISDDLMITDEPMTETEPEVTTSAKEGRGGGFSGLYDRVRPKYPRKHWGKKGLDSEPPVSRNSCL